MTLDPSFPDITLYVVDTSAWVRAPLHPEVQRALAALGASGVLALAPPVALEVGFSARNAQEWDTTHVGFSGFPVLPMSARTYEIARDLQGDLWHHGLVRAVGCTDLLIAAVAIEHHATVLHYDRDYELLAQVRADFRHEWIVPAGSMD